MMQGTATRRGVLGLAAAGALGLSNRRASAASDDGLTGTLNVSTFKQTSYLTAYYLHKFAPPGLKINISEAESNSDVLDALLTGSIDVGYMGVIACIIAASRDRPLKAVASTASKTTRIVVRKDSPYKTIADLKGKNVGIAKATNQDIIFRELVRQAGLNPKKDIDFILVPTPSQVEALVSGTVDAVATSEPNGSILLLSGVGRELVTDVNHTPVGDPGIVVSLS
jgi:ABC-type nitrate/sulfonate/bicarbonate transport system substrate-binding protein